MSKMLIGVDFDLAGWVSLSMADGKTDNREFYNGSVIVIYPDGRVNLEDEPTKTARALPLGRIWNGLHIVDCKPGPGIPEGSNCIVVPEDVQVEELDIWAFAKEHNAFIPDDPDGEASDGPCVIIRFGTGQQEVLDDDQLHARLYPGDSE